MEKIATEEQACGSTGSSTCFHMKNKVECSLSGHFLTTTGNTAKDYFTPRIHHRRQRWAVCWVHSLLSLNLNRCIANTILNMYNHISKRVLQRAGNKITKITGLVYDYIKLQLLPSMHLLYVHLYTLAYKFPTSYQSCAVCSIFSLIYLKRCTLLS